MACLALGEHVALAQRTKTKGWVDREAERELVALDRDTGGVRWRHSPHRGEVIAVTRAHVLLSDDGEAPVARALDLETGAEAQRSGEGGLP